MMKTLADNSVDSLVSDPPYELGFMSRGWDSSGIAYDPDVWAQCLRVLKPGGHILAFSGTRTYHRMVVAIEDAGFEIRDQIGWLYGSGMPKGLDVSKAIDKAAGAQRAKVRFAPRPESSGTVAGSMDERPCLVREREQGYLETEGREAVTEEAKRWQGWNTALKPSWEPICLARKPLVGTVVANVLQHGTGALNINATRVGGSGGTQNLTGIKGPRENRRTYNKGFGDNDGAVLVEGMGRWPANVIHDGSKEVVHAFPRTNNSQKGDSVRTFGGNKSLYEHGMQDGYPVTNYGDGGTAARFYYSAKASRADRGGDGNIHPTVKPISLMRYLCRLITPPGGVVLDPFMGSGSTIIAARMEGFRPIGIDLMQEHVDIVRGRLDGTLNTPDEDDDDDDVVLRPGTFF